MKPLSGVRSLNPCPPPRPPTDTITPSQRGRRTPSRRRKTPRSPLDVALRFLSYRGRSEAEIRRRLSKDFSPQQVEETVARLKESRLLDDAAFAKAWRNSRERHAPRSRFMIRQELAQRGVRGEVAENALEGLDEEEMAQRVAAKFLRRLSGLDRRTFHTRMMGYLRRRGFNYRTSADTTQRLWTELSKAPEVSD